MIATAKAIYAELPPTLETLKILACATDAKEDKVETAGTPDRRKHLSEQLESHRPRFSKEYSQFLAGTGQQGESFTSAQTPEWIASS